MNGMVLGLRVLVMAFATSMGVLPALASEPFVTFDQPKPIPEFQLQDHQGQAFDLTSLKGAWSLVFIGFTSCPDVCPVTLMKLEAVRAELGLRFRPENIPQIIFLAVDPARDRPVLGQYLGHFHPQNIGVTGEPKQLDVLVKALEGFYRLQKPKPGSDYYDVVHTAAIAVVNPAGEMTASMNPPFHVQPIAEFLTHLIRRGPADE